MICAQRPDDQAILDARRSLLESPVFARSERLRAFLTYIVAREIEGNGHQLKGYSIGVDVFGRPPAFNSDSDPLVRVHAGKLRKLLDLHYEGPGVGDPWRIRVPKGSYVPVYERNRPFCETATTGSAPVLSVAEGRPGIPVDTVVPVQRRTKWRPAPLSSSRALLSVLPLLLFMPLTAPAMNVGLSGENRLGSHSQQSHLPRISIRVDGDSDIARRFADALMDAAAPYRAILSVTRQRGGARRPPAPLDYTVEIASQARPAGIRLRIADATSMQPIHDIVIASADLTDEGDLLFQSHVVADQTLSAQGVVFRHALDQETASQLMRCVFLTDLYRTTLSRETFTQAKSCQDGLSGSLAFTLDHDLLSGRKNGY